MYLEYKVIDNKYTNINQILKQEFKLSARLIHKVISNKLVLLNNIPIDTRTTPDNGDIIKVDLSYEEENDNIVPTKMELNILYEDEWLVIINKSAGMAVHSSTKEPDMDTVEDALYAYLPRDERPHPVSRLDRGTTGVMTVAKCGYMHALMKRIMEQGQFEKRYLAILSRVPEKAVAHG